MAAPQPTGPIRMATVGAGWVSQNRHMPALDQDPDVAFTGVIVPEDQLAAPDRAALQKRFGALRFGPSLDVDWMAEIDAVMVGTPPDTHPDLVVAALDAGKHVLVEKPFALTTAEADRMLDAAAANDRIVSVVHNFQFARAANHARSVIAGGGLGELKAVFGVQSSNHERRLPSWYRGLPLGLFTDEAPHLVYLLQSFLPDADLESLHVGRPLGADDNTPDLVSMVLRDGDVVGSLHMTFVGALSEWMVVILGTRSTLVLDLFRDVCFTMPNDHGHLAADVLRSQLRAVGGHLVGTFGAGTQRLRGKLDYGNAEVVRHFVAAVRSGEPDPHIDGTRGRDVVRILEAAHRAAGPTSAP
jgi:predicted dehydrogenase